jgi:hypothetical protein
MSNSCEVNTKPKSFKELMRSKSFWKTIAGIVLGGTGGFLYFYFVGCSTGSCGITSNPYSSIAFGSVLGIFLTNRKCGC